MTAKARFRCSRLNGSGDDAMGSSGLVQKLDQLTFPVVFLTDAKKYLGECLRWPVLR
jgi:hypothetical protein